MNVKKSLESRIRGWLPQEPYIPKSNSSILAQKHTFFPIAAGLLSTIASFAIFFIGVLQLMPFMAYLISKITGSSYFYNPNILEILLLGIVNVACFIFGMKAGMFAMGRKRYAFSIAGPILVFLANAITMAFIGLTQPHSLISSLTFALPIAVTSMLSIAFVRISRNEFTQRRTCGSAKNPGEKI
jgi:hypothetical protein